MILFFFFILIIIFLIFYFTILLGGLLLAVPVPTPQKAVEAMLKLAQVTSKDKVYDLGCGDGRIIITAAKKFNALGVGFELSLFHFLYTKMRIFKEGLRNKVKVFYKNFYKADLSEASVITIFGYPSKMKKVGEMLLKKARPKTRVISYAFPIPNLKLIRKLKIKDCAPIFLYEVSIDKE